MKTAKKHLALLVTLLTLLLAACSQTPTPTGELESAFTIDPRVYAKGWVWANVPNSTIGVAYTPNTRYQYNSRIDRTSTGIVTYPAADNKVVRRGLGSYEVIFPNLGVRGGVVHVSAYGGKHTCKVVRWDADLAANALNLKVRCFDPNTGASLNGRFTALFYKDGAKSTEYADAYVWANQESAASIYTPALQYNYNSRGVNNTVERTTRGEYIVRMPQMDVRGGLSKFGNVMVTAYGNGNVYCKNTGWSLPNNELTAMVRCYKGGVLEDSQFTLSYFRDPSTLAIRNAAGKQQAWYVWADVSPIPTTGYQSDSYGNSDARLTRLAAGSYRIHLPRIAAVDKTIVHVTAYDTNTAYCNLVNWVSNLSGGTNVNVKCYDPSGVAADTVFSLYYTSDDPR